MEYRVNLTRDAKTNRVIASFPDVPEAHTVGKNNMEAYHRSLDALATALDGYIKDRREIPASVSKGGLRVVIPQTMKAKLELYGALLGAGLTKYALAKKLNWHAPQVDRLFDLKYQTSLESIIAAAGELNQRIGLSVNTLEHVTKKCPACGNETTLSYTPGSKTTDSWLCLECGAMHKITVPGSGLVSVASVSRRALARAAR